MVNPIIEVNRETGDFTIRGKLDPDAFRPSASGKTTLLLAGAGTQVQGACRGSLNLYVTDPANVINVK